MKGENQNVELKIVKIVKILKGARFLRSGPFRQKGVDDLDDLGFSPVTVFPFCVFLMECNPHPRETKI